MDFILLLQQNHSKQELLSVATLWLHLLYLRYVWSGTSSENAKLPRKLHSILTTWASNSLPRMRPSLGIKLRLWNSSLPSNLGSHYNASAWRCCGVSAQDRGGLREYAVKSYNGVEGEKCGDIKSPRNKFSELTGLRTAQQEGSLPLRLNKALPLECARN